MRWALILCVTAWSAVAAAAPPATCDGPLATKLTSFENAARILHLRIAAATPGASTDRGRCVALDLELVDEFRGSGPEKPHDHIRLVVRQSMITAYTDRPAGAWWVVEEELAAGRELVAFCPGTGAAAAQLREDCSIQTAEPALLGDLGLARDAERGHFDLGKLLARARAQCATSSYILSVLVWSRHGDQAMKDLGAFEQIARLLEDPKCSRVMRGSLLIAVYDAVTMIEDAPRTRRLALALFRLLAMPEAADLHDNLIEPYLPNLLGLTGGLPKHTAAEVLGADGLRMARAAVAAYHGRSDAAPLRTWLR